LIGTGIPYGSWEEDEEEEEEEEEEEKLHMAPAQGIKEYFTVDFLGKITTELVSLSGQLLKLMEAPSANGTHQLEIDEGTRAFDDKGNLVTSIEIRQVEAPDLPDDTRLVGEAYEFKPSGIIFEKPIRLTLSYNVNELPENVTSVGIAYYTTDVGWTYLETESTQVAELGKLTASVKHFTIFATLAKVEVPPAPPADFKLGDLSITPSVSKIWGKITFMARSGKEVVINVDVTNDGGQEGNYTVILKINDVTRETKEISLAPGQTQKISFTVIDNEPGTYVVQIGDLTGDFLSEFWINWWLTLGLVAAFILLCWFILSRIKGGKPADQATEE